MDKVTQACTQHTYGMVGSHGLKKIALPGMPSFGHLGEFLERALIEKTSKIPAE